MKGDRKMKKRVLMVLPVMAVLLLAVGSIAASATFARKVTGDIEFTMPFGLVPPPNMAQCQAEFDVHEAADGRPVKGSYHWRGYNAQTGWVWVDFQVNCVTFHYDEDGPFAVFSGPVTDTGGPDYWTVKEGEYVAIWVRDGGTPGRKGDRLGYYIGDGGVAFTEDPGCDPEGGGLAGSFLFRDPFITLTGGNLVIHD